MLDIGIQEILIIMVLALLVFGPDKLPDLGRRLGRAMREFRRASDEFRSTVEQNLQLNVDPDISPASSPSAEPAAAAAATVGATDSQPAAVDGHGSEASSVESVGAGVRPADWKPVEDLLEPYWTSRGGRLLHRRECAWRARVPASELIPLKAAADGWDQGLKPCPACDPKEVPVAS